MTAGDQYRIKAAGFQARGQAESNLKLRIGFEHLARAYLRLAEQADRNSTMELVYEPPPPRLDDPEIKQ